MLRNKSVVIWGDGAVGKGLAVALSGSWNVFLAGPAGSGTGRMKLQSTGAFPGETVIAKIETGEAVHCDYCVVALKAYDLKSAAEPAMKSTDGRCICLSNGMGLEREWGVSWEDRVEPAVLTAGFYLRESNSVETSQGNLIVSSGGEAEALFRASPLEVVPAADMEIVRWSKWLANSVINPLGALSGKKNNKLLEAGLGIVANELFKELVEVIPESIRVPAKEKASEMLDFLLNFSSNRCSMLQDILEGRETEIDFLTGLCENQFGKRCPAASVMTDLVKAASMRLSCS